MGEFFQNFFSNEKRKKKKEEKNLSQNLSGQSKKSGESGKTDKIGQFRTPYLKNP